MLTGLKNRGLLAQESAKRWASYRLSRAVLDIFPEKPIHKTDKEKSIKKTYQENRPGKAGDPGILPGAAVGQGNI